MKDSEFLIFLVPITAGQALEQPDFTAGNLPFAGDDGVFMPV
jgi:hypothetical protein